MGHMEEIRSQGRTHERWNEWEHELATVMREVVAIGSSERGSEQMGHTSRSSDESLALPDGNTLRGQEDITDKLACHNGPSVTTQP